MLWQKCYEGNNYEKKKKNPEQNRQMEKIQSLITLIYLRSVRNLISPAVNDIFPQLISFYLLINGKQQTIK